MTVRRVVTVVFDLAMLAAASGLVDRSPMASGSSGWWSWARCVLIVFVAAVFAVGLLDQRRPPYPMA